MPSPAKRSADPSEAGAPPHPITNLWGRVEPLRVPVEHRTVFRGVRGAAYNHHQQLAGLDGTLYATWSCGERDEDTPGQAMMLATSEDGGRSWSEPRVLTGPDEPRGVCTAMGLHIHQGRLVAYCGHYEMSDHGMLMYYATGGNASLGDPERPSHLGAHTRIYVSDDAGASWDGPVATIPGFVPNLAPSPLASGRLLMPGNFRYPYTDDPAGIEGWHLAGLPGVPDDVPDEAEGHVVADRIRGGDYGLCEGSFFQTDDGVIHMMLRTTAGRLAVTESADEGRTWSEPALTGYTDCECRFHFGRLPDGRFFGLSCPEPKSERRPMVLATSGDGVRFDRHYLLGEEPPFLARIPGVHKYGRYGYPSLHLAEDRAVAIYSVNKEDIAVARFELAALE